MAGRIYDRPLYRINFKHLGETVMKDLQEKIIDKIGGKHRDQLMKEMEESMKKQNEFYAVIDQLRAKWQADNLAESWKYYQEEDSHYLNDDQQEGEE